MLNKKELAEIRERFKAARMDKPLRIEGEHLQGETIPVSLGWDVYSAVGHGLKENGGSKEYPVVYAKNTTFEAASFLAHLPVDMPRMLQDLEDFHLLLEAVLAGNESALEEAKWIVAERRKRNQ